MASRMGIVFSVFFILFAIFWTVMAVSMPGPSPIFVLFGILFIMLAVYRLYMSLRKTPEPPRVDTAFRTVPDEGEPVHRVSPNGYCPYCGTPLDSDYEYCPLCGKRI